MARVIGLNSGSSFDGVDVVLVEIEDGPDGFPARPQFIAGNSYDWPDAVAEIVLRAFENKVSLFELTRLNYLAGAVYAQAARAFMRENRLEPGDVEVIGYDGQTIYQEPPVHQLLRNYDDAEDLVSRWLDGPYPCGLQIGEPSIVAEACETPVVTHFRPMEHALAGTGAPLMQYLDYVAFRDIGPILTLNIGGIANCQLAHADRSRMMAFDTGPGNVMIDHVMRTRFGKPYDKNGAIARTGKADEKLMAKLKEHDFFKRPVPRSAWRLDFGSAYADKFMEEFKHLSSEDLLATVTEFAAYAITRSIRDNVKNLVEISTIMASGGGTRNTYLMERLAAHMPKGLRLTLSDEFGVPAAFKEAIKFAALAHATINLFANNIPAASGAKRFGILGKLVQPPRLARY
ncbi:MAG: anhydro-N-acetylmuramic acid kinase [Pseudomonadota bacterium]|nr:anhydro-N-acetylmuramic acid kinase [Pseudomonadota bacterium]